MFVCSLIDGYDTTGLRRNIGSRTVRAQAVIFADISSLLLHPRIVNGWRIGLPLRAGADRRDCLPCCWRTIRLAKPLVTMIGDGS